MGVYSNLASKCNTVTNSNISNPMEMAIKSQNIQLSLFESMIQLDILSAKNESGMISVSESVLMEAEETAKKSLWQKFKDMLHGFVEWIKAIFRKISDKFLELTKNDKALVDKYDKIIKSNNYDLSKANFKILDIDKFNKDFEIDIFDDSIDCIDKLCELINTLIKKKDEFNEKINNGKSFDKIKEDIDNSLDKVYKTFNINETNLETISKKKYDPDNYYTEISKESIMKINNLFCELVLDIDKNYLKDIKNFMQSSTKQLDNTINDLEKNKPNDSDSKDNNDIIMYIYTKCLEVASKIKSYTGKAFSIYINILSLRYKLLRKNFIKIGEYAIRYQNSNISNDNNINTTEEETKTNEAYSYMLGEASDLYIESVLEF